MIDLPVQFQWTISPTTLIASSAVVVAAWKLARVIKLLIDPFREIMSEHNTLWEDYNLRTGGSYRRSTGRGAPPDPEEFYRKHPRADRGDLEL